MSCDLTLLLNIVLLLVLVFTVGVELTCIQVDPDLIPLIRAAYTNDLKTKIAGSHPDDHTRLEAVLKATDEEENRTARLYAAGKISEDIWDALWEEWQDRRHKVRRTLEMLTVDHETHIENLELALQIIARIGTLYNGLQRSDQKELLRQVVHRVVVNEAGNVRLELRTPFAYLCDLTDEIRLVQNQSQRRKAEKKTGGRDTTGPSGACSNQVVTGSRLDNSEFSREMVGKTLHFGARTCAHLKPADVYACSFPLSLAAVRRFARA